ncbi:MAG TPA: hypothetical protein ENK82_01100, partial [Campylobacterales bacterium]|nr:hypothetical protein [Campylobacterales bacterium]
MKPLTQKFYQSLALSSIIFFATGCMPKNADGTYNSAYSYHPYNQDQSNSYKEPYSSYSNIANKIEKDSLSLVGTDYQYGANGPDQYDCSSFTKYVFSKQGIT